MNRIYCISGIGADERIFKHLSISGYEIFPVRWPAFAKEDTLVSYAHKISAQIPGEKPIILGMSFGGMLAVEIGKIRATEKIFLVSSAKTVAELPAISRMPNAAMLLDMVPEFAFKSSSFINFRAIGARNNDDRNLITAMLEATASGFIRWALKAVVQWQNTTYLPNVIHIHGTADVIIPGRNMQPDYWLEGGSHIMIYNRVVEVNRIISYCLSR